MTYANIKLKTHSVPVYDEQGNNMGNQDMESTVHPFIQDFLNQLALKYPQWTFEEDDHRFSWSGNKNRSPEADKFVIKDKREELGFVAIDHYSRRGKLFVVDNFRVAKQRTRGRGFRTIHQHLAMKHVAKFFGKRDYTEIMEQAQSAANSVVASTHYELDSKARHNWRALDSYAHTFLNDVMWDAFSAFVRDCAPASVVAKLETYPEAYANCEAATAVRNAANDGSAYLIHIVDSDYLVKRKDEVQVLSSAELPNTVRGRLGMLKLVQDGQIIGGSGMRVDENTYYVIGE